MTQVADLIQPARRPRNYAPWVTTAILVALTAFLTWRGIGYYRQDLVTRTENVDHPLLRPAGLIGHGYGIVGTGLILTNLLYLPRRRFAKIIPMWVGTMKSWLNVHVVTGLAGALLVVFHSAFQLRTPIATVTAMSLAIVIVTGLVGLYLYALLPKPTLKRFKARLGELEPIMPELVGRVTEYVEKVPCTRLPADASLMKTLLTVPRWVLEARARRRAVWEAARGDKTFRVLLNTDRALGRAIVEELAMMAAAEVDTLALGSLVRSWRSIHRFLALLMVVSVTVHIAVAYFYGFRWIWSK